MKYIISIIILIACLSVEAFSQTNERRLDGFYIKAHGFYDIGSYFPEKKAEFQLQDTNYFLTFGAEAGVYRGTFTIGVSFAHGNEFEEDDKELLFGERDYTSYSRILISVSERFIGTRSKSIIQAHLGSQAAAGFMLFKAKEGTGETEQNPITWRDDYLTQNITATGAHLQVGLYVELGVKLKGNKSILLNYHPIEITINNRSYGFNLVKTSLIFRF